MSSPLDADGSRRRGWPAAIGGPALVKGLGTVREDPFHTQFVSTNGLPKKFDRALLDLVPTQCAANFVFDIQLLLAARDAGWSIEEIPVLK